MTESEAGLSFPLLWNLVSMGFSSPIASKVSSEKADVVVVLLCCFKREVSRAKKGLK
jgi:hypothetical protein